MSSSILAVSKTSATGYCVEVKTELVAIEWVLKDFESLLLGNEECINSPVFRTVDTGGEWILELYPRGYLSFITDGSGTNVSILLRPYNRAPSLFEIAFNPEISISASGRTILFLRIMNERRCELHAVVERSRLLEFCQSDDTITIRCRIMIPDGSIAKPIEKTKWLQKSCDSQEGQLSQVFCPLFKASRFSDVVVAAGDRKFPAHKLVLAARSPVFSAMFEHEETIENLRKVVEIEDMEPDIVEALLEFFYTDKVTNLEGLACGLLGAANKYDVTLLRNMCEKVLHDTLNEENAAEILIHADLYRCNDLKEHVMEFMADHMFRVIESEGYKEIEEKYPSLLKEMMRKFAVHQEFKKRKLAE